MKAIIQEIKEQYLEVELQLSDPTIFNDAQKLAVWGKKHKELKTRYELGVAWVKLHAQLKEASLMQQDKDPEFKAMGRQIENETKKQLVTVEAELNALLSPSNPMDKKDVIMEIRAGAGGVEAAYFAQDLMRMYLRYATSLNLNCEIIDLTETNQGVKEATIELTGANAYGYLKHESGVHSVQRVPKTETQGRVHTSTVSVVVRPVIEETELVVNQADLKTETFRSSGPGGQHANKVESGVRITHLPTGISASSQMKSQLQNRQEAMKVLRARLFERQEQDELTKLSQLRKDLVGTSDRSEKIRTYNFKESRVTDHRSHVTLYQLEQILNGDLTQLTNAIEEKQRIDNLNQS